MTAVQRRPPQGALQARPSKGGLGVEGSCAKQPQARSPGGCQGPPAQPTELGGGLLPGTGLLQSTCWAGGRNRGQDWASSALSPQETWSASTVPVLARAEQSLAWRQLRGSAVVRPDWRGCGGWDAGLSSWKAGAPPLGCGLPLPCSCQDPAVIPFSTSGLLLLEIKQRTFWGRGPPKSPRLLLRPSNRGKCCCRGGGEESLS